MYLLRPVPAPDHIEAPNILEDLLHIGYAHLHIASQSAD